LRLEELESRVVPTGTWTPVATPAPTFNGLGAMLLLPDGRVIVNEEGTGQTASSNWYALTPDSTGNYANGQWSVLQPMTVARRFFASDVLPSGEVFVAGGEYSSDGNQSSSGEIYSPVFNSWSPIQSYPPGGQMGDAISEVLADGTVLVGDHFSSTTQRYDPSTNTWSADASLLNGDTTSEESWVKLPDGSILSYEIQGSMPQTGQRFVPGATHAQDQWVPAGTVPLRLDSTGKASGFVPELGPGLLLPNGNVFFIGASGSTALYTPPSTPLGTGSWTAGRPPPLSLPRRAFRHPSRRWISWAPTMPPRARRSEERTRNSSRLCPTRSTRRLPPAVELGRFT
jgi:hypothetical protein